MLMALLLFLAAAMVSAVVISAAITAAKRVTDDHDYEQSCQTVSSAAIFLSDALTGSKACREVVSRRDEAGRLVPESGVWSVEGSLGSGDRLSEELLDAVRYTATYGETVPEGDNSPVCTAHFTVSAEGFPDVDVAFAMDRNYYITLVCTEREGGVSSHRSTVKLKCTHEHVISDGDDSIGWRSVDDWNFRWEPW